MLSKLRSGYKKIILVAIIVFFLVLVGFYTLHAQIVKDQGNQSDGQILGVYESLYGFITVAANCYWVGATNPANWNNANNWASSAGGTPGTCDTGVVPGDDDTVYFTSDNTYSANIDTSVSVAGFIIQSGYTGTITQQAGYTVTVGTTNNFSQADGTFTGGSNDVTFNGTFTLTGGVFNATSTNTIFNNSFTHNVASGTFNEGTGKVKFGVASAKTIDVNSSETFYDVEFANSHVTAWQIGSGDTLVISHDLTLTDGRIYYGTINAERNISQSANFDGGYSSGYASRLNFANDGLVQTYTLESGSWGPYLYLDSAADASDIITLNGDAGLWGLNMTAGFSGTAPFTYNGHNLTINLDGFTLAGGTFDAPATLIDMGNFTHTAATGTFNEGTGTVRFTRGLSTFDVNSTETLYDVEVALTTGYDLTIASGDTMVVDGTLTLTDGLVKTGTMEAKKGITIATTFDGGTAAMKMTGTIDQTLTLSSGVTPTGTLTVTKSSNTAYITGSGNLHNISLTQGILQFQGGSTYTIDDADAVTTSAGTTLNFTGTLGNLVTLKSDVVSCETGGAGAQWSLNVNASGSYSSNYVDVKCSDASPGRQITTFNSTNSGNNTNWVFSAGSPLDVSGTCQKYDQSTNCANGETVRAAVNGSLNGDAVFTSSGAWSVTNMSYNSGDIITIFIDGVADDLEANAVTKYDGSGGITGVLLYEEHLTIGSDDNQTLTNANLSSYDNSVSVDEDIFFDVDGSNVLTVDSLGQSSQEELYVKSGNTHQPGAAVNSHDVEITGTFDVGSSTISVSGSWVNSGTFTASTSTIDFTASAGTETLNSGGTGIGKLFNNLNHSGASTLQLLINALDINGDFNNSAGTFDANNLNINAGGSWANTAAFTAGTSTVTFDATDSGNTLSGTLNGASAFYKVVFSGLGGDWTIQGVMKVSAANATDTFVVGNGTVTLGDSNGDNLEVDGKMTIAATAGQTGTFQTAALSQGDILYLDINDNATRPSCANCIIQVGQSSAESGQGNLKIRKNTILRLNRNDSSSHTGVKVERTGYLEIQGSQDVNNATSTNLDSVALRETKLCANTDFSAGHANKNIRMNSGLAIGKIYDIASSTVDDTDCASDTDDSLTRADNSSDTDLSPTVSGAGPTRTLTLSGETIVTAADEHIGRYVHNLTDDKYYKIVDSTEAGSDTLKIISEPDDFATMDTNDDIEVTDGTKPGDTFDVLDYASVTAHNGTACDASVAASYAAYIDAKDYSETKIQYAQVCNLGKSVGYYGINATSIDDSGTNEGISINKSRIYNGYYGLWLNGSTNNTISENSFYGNQLYGIYLYSGSNNNNLLSNNFYGNNYGIYFTSTPNSNTLTSNILYNNTTYGIALSSGTANNLTSNIAYSNGSIGILVEYYNNTLTSNTAFGNDSVGIDIGGVQAHNNTLVSNTTYANGIYGVSALLNDNLVLASHTSYSNRSSGIEIGGSTNNTLYNNNSYYNDGHGINFSENALRDTRKNTLFSSNFYNNTDINSVTAGVEMSGGASGNVLFANTSYNNNYGLMLFSAAAETGNMAVNDNYGGSGANTQADVTLGGGAQGAHQLRLYNTTLASSLEATGVVVSNAYVISRKNDTILGLTKVWGEYSIPDQDNETPQDETTDKYNYAENLWGNSFTPHGYAVGYGAGAEDSDLDYGWGGAFGGNNSVYHYRILCTAANCVTTADSWAVYRNGTLLTNLASTGSTYTDTQNDGGSAPNIQFKIDDAGDDYTAGATYTFTVYKAGGGIDITKNVKMMQDGDTYTAGTGKTWEMVGDATHRTTSTHNSGNDGYNYIVDGGTIDFEFADYDYLKGNKGIDIRANSNVVSLTDTKYDNYVGSAAADDAFITVAASVIDSHELTFLNCQFDNPGLEAEFNVHRIGADDVGYWFFHLSTGDYDGEALDGGNGVDEDDPGMIRWDPWGSPSPSPSTSTSPSTSPTFSPSSGENQGSLPTTGGLDFKNPLTWILIGLVIFLIISIPILISEKRRAKSKERLNF